MLLIVWQEEQKLVLKADLAESEMLIQIELEFGAVFSPLR